MPSSKGKPTDPKLREEAKEEVKNMEKGGGKGQWSAFKAAEMSKRYEAKGGGYEDQGDNPNEASKGAPKPNKDAVEKGERKAADAPVGEKKKPASKGGDKRKADDKKDEEEQEEKKKDNDDKEKKKNDDEADEKEEKKDDGEKAANGKKESASAREPKEPKEKKQRKEQKEPAKGTRTQPTRGAKK